MLARSLAVFGFAPGQISGAPNRNVSLGRKALAATLAANRAAQSREERAAFDAALCSMPGRFGSAQAFFTQAATAKVRRTIIADRQFLRQQFDLKLPKPEKPGHMNTIAISEREFGEIAALTRELGDYGGHVPECLGRFVTREPMDDEKPE